MGNINLVISGGILAFFFLYFYSQLDKEHLFLKLMLLVFATLSIMVIPWGTYEECSTNLINASETETITPDVTERNTTYAWNTTCVPVMTQSRQTLGEIPLWFFRIALAYFLIYSFYLVITRFYNRMDKTRRRGGEGFEGGEEKKK